MKHEHILAIDKKSIEPQLESKYNKLISVLQISPLNVFIGHREHLDNFNGIGDRNYLQAIGYAVVTHPDKGILAYRRKGSEGRLDGKISIGFGGHTSISDIVLNQGTEEINIESSVSNGTLREINEELVFDFGKQNLETNYQNNSFITNAHNPEFLGFIACDRTDVDLLHLGFVYKFSLNRNVEGAKLGDHGEAIFWINDLNEIDLNNCEEWTKIILSSLQS